MAANPLALKQPPAVERPRLIFVFSTVSGRSRRVEGYLSQILQRRRNHEAFRLYRIEEVLAPWLR